MSQLSFLVATAQSTAITAYLANVVIVPLVSFAVPLALIALEADAGRLKLIFLACVARKSVMFPSV